ncbi:leucine-rich repeat-containing protein 72 [Pelobates fuscus]|uniref:leucine-rich repeat-containing protein 72 n=1 Tax=Pelobates fuscus TaxID=191477 RepID=UPI002FE4C334
MSLAIIEEQLHKCGYKTDSDVSELYLGRKGLKEVTDLSRFRMLRYLWLNHNKISKITCLTNVCRLSELYLNNNELCDIAGSLKNLTSLRILMLNDNYLTKLQDTVKELKGMTSLHTLNLFRNPLAQDAGHRLYVIYHLSSVQLLDRENVTHKEREDAFKLFNPEQTAVIQSIGFGRRTDSVLPVRRPLVKSSSASCARMSLGNNNNADYQNRHKNGAQDVLQTARQRSVMQYSLLDWSTLPSSSQKYREGQTFQPAQFRTVELR